MNWSACKKTSAAKPLDEITRFALFQLNENTNAQITSSLAKFSSTN